MTVHRKKLLISILTFVTLQVNGQLTVNSPYSRYALGSLKDLRHAHLDALGSPTAAFADSALMNPGNPASWAFIMQKRPLLDIQTEGDNHWYATQNETDLSRTFALTHVGLGIPVNKRLGFGLGVSPFSRTGYIIRDVDSSDTHGDFTYTYDGQGDLNKVYGGFAYRPLVRKRMSLSVGANASYIFGSYSHNRRLDFEDLSYMSTLVSSATDVRDVLFDFGAILALRDSASGLRFNFGATLSLGSAVNAERDEVAMNLKPTGTGEYFLRDTAYYLNPVKGTLNLPMTFNAGATIDWRSSDDATKNPGRHARRVLGNVNYYHAKWSDYTEKFDTSVNQGNTGDAFRISAGLQFTPFDMRRPDKSKSIFSKMNYRLAFSYGQDYLVLRKTPLKDVGITFGLGMPLLFSGSLSSINVSATLGERGTTDNNLIKEQYLLYKIGFTFSPHIYDRWFLKRKYD